MKKRLVTVVLMLCLAFGLVACGSNGANNDTEKNNTETQQDDAQTNKDSEEESEENVEDGKIEYKVTLVDADGNPVAGQMIQVCNAATCFAPVVTDANGVATFRLEESNEYKAKLLTASDDAYVYFEAGKTELTLTME